MPPNSIQSYWIKLYLFKINFDKFSIISFKTRHNCNNLIWTVIYIIFTVVFFKGLLWSSWLRLSGSPLSSPLFWSSSVVERGQRAWCSGIPKFLIPVSSTSQQVCTHIFFEENSGMFLLSYFSVITLSKLNYSATFYA